MSPDAAAGTPLDIVRAHRGRILATYALTLVENVFWLLYPWAIGVAVDGLIAGDRTALLPLLAVWLAHIVTGTARQLYDSRLFTRVHRLVAIRTALGQAADGAADGVIAARIGMARDMTIFLEREVPEALTAAISLVGAVAMLLVYDAVLAVAVVLFLVPIVLVTRRFASRSARLHRHLNDRMEREVAIVTRRLPRQLDRHFAILGRSRVRLSDAEAVTFAAVEILALALTMLALLRLTGGPTTQVGEVFAVLSYLWRVLESLDALPFLTQQVARLADIRRRLAGPAG